MSPLIINPEKEKLLRMPEHRQQQLLHLQKPRKEDLPTEEAINNATVSTLKVTKEDA